MKRFLTLFLCVAALALGDVRGQQSLQISELMFNPVPSGADWLELYNSADHEVSLADVRLVRWVGDSLGRFYAIDSVLVGPNDYVVITTDATFLMANYGVRYPGKVVQVSSMPAYNDASGTVILALRDSTIIDRFDYTATMHSQLLRDKEGVSLERRSFDRPTQEPSNWYSASSTSGYGTPTYANSQSTEFLFLDNDFSLSTDIVSPDGDGYNDQLDITYNLNDNTLAANITLFDRTGRVVRTLCRGALLGSVGVVTWDGADNRGRACLPGRYVVAIELYNTTGRSQTIKRTVAVMTH
ncbi:MAG: lamin tail domain-containing protein [Bacteroidales bacterium]|nr:lamin tail domain-containing protein [Bacteroidales bacterium]